MKNWKIDLTIWYDAIRNHWNGILFSLFSSPFIKDMEIPGKQTLSRGSPILTRKESILTKSDLHHLHQKNEITFLKKPKSATDH